MKLIESQAKLKKFGQPFLQTSDVASILCLSRAHASKIMTRLSAEGLATQLTRGRWALTENNANNIDRFLIPEFLVAPSLSYISLQSALFYHGMISQIPETIFAVSTSKTRKYKTELGVFSVHHLEPELLFGFEVVGKSSVKMATPEKALLDTLYLSPGKSGLFRNLPEIELTDQFDKTKAYLMVEQITAKPRRTLIENKLKQLLK